MCIKKSAKTTVENGFCRHFNTEHLNNVTEFIISQLKPATMNFVEFFSDVYSEYSILGSTSLKLFLFSWAIQKIITLN